MTDALVEAVATRLERLVAAESMVLVAVSGGPDSLALLDLLHRGTERHGRHLRVVHVDHGIDPSSGRIAEDVAGHAAARGLAVDVLSLGLGPGASETRARRARRQALRVLLAQVERGVIALGHHADDQIETVLLRVLRGSGPAGLAGMAARRGPWIRPLLEIPHAALVAHCEAQNLSPWQDPANRDPRHLRSWLRTVALPLLRERVPDVEARLGAVAAQAATLRQGVNALPEALESLAFRVEDGGFSVAAPTLIGYPSGLQSMVLQALGRRCGVPLGVTRRREILRLVAGQRSGGEVRISPALVVELAFGRLHFRRPGPDGLAEQPLPAAGELVYGAHRFHVVRGPAAASGERVSRETWLGQGAYRVRQPVAGDRIVPIGGTGRRSVAVLLREARVPAGLRHQWPVVVSASDPAVIVWIPGICRSTVNVPVVGEEALHVRCDLT
ncbi:MAG TPA: tRNA lysidine(34) synthetase TilS [Gemmatimonadales bacterium]|nr:tRNA lysidine(34) synthetase TilS [Gemmatimonadales bacterium]